MTHNEEKNLNIPGYLSIISLAGLVGIVGGFLFGIWDSFTVMIDHGIAFNALREMFFLSLYAVAIYTVLGFLSMAIIGLFSSIIIKIGKYDVNKKQLARIFIGIFTILAVSVILADLIIFGNIADILETTIIGIFCGIGTGVFSIYVLTHASGIKLNMEKLISLGISFFIPLLVFIYSGLFINIKLLSSEPFYHPLSLISNIGLFIIVILLAIGLYRLTSLIFTRYSNNGLKWTGYTLITIVLCVFIVISLIGPFTRDKVELIDSGDATGKPNILWIVMDTARADHLSCYGYYRNTTPNIDRIASEGVLYENVISAAPWTLPSHASMFTGTFVSKHGTDSEQKWLKDDFQTIAEVLRMNGYSTFEYTNNKYVGPGFNLSQGFDVVEECLLGKLEVGSESYEYLKVSNFKRIIQNQFLMDDGAQRTNEVVKEWIAEAYQAATPFFLFINYMEVHRPYHPPREYVIPFLGEDVDMAKVMSINQKTNAYNLGKVKMSDEDFEILKALYDGEFLYLDYKIGQLFDYLKELDILDDTILIITADHGENFGEHYLMGHHLCIYDTLLHVPLIIRYPESFEAGLRASEQVQLVDIFPTILDITGIEWVGDEQIQGCSLFKDREQCQLKFAVSEHAICSSISVREISRDRNYGVPLYNRRLKAVRTKDYKYIWASDGCDELYKISLDPEELNNLIDTEPEKASKMKEMLIEWLNSFETFRPEAGIQIE